LLQSVERRLTHIESSLNLRITAVETSLEVAHEKSYKVDWRVYKLNFNYMQLRIAKQ